MIRKDNKIRKAARPVLAGILAAAMMMTMAGCGSASADKGEAATTQSAEKTVKTTPTPLTKAQTDKSNAALKALEDADAIRSPQVQLKGNGEDKVTVLVYMNGSNLESEGGAATADIMEMVQAGTSDKVNVLIETGGTKTWADTYNIASDRTQIHKVVNGGIETIRDDMGQLDMTAPSTLEDFIKWGVSYAPADRYMLIFWDHGGGAVYGYGYDEWVSDENAALTIDEMQTALKNAGVYFDVIGMDCCIMSSLEVACALYDYCDYTILSEDFESGIGWSYTGWMQALNANTSIPTTELGTQIVDEMVTANKNDTVEGSDSIMALIDEGYMKVLYTAWKDFAYANEETLLSDNYSRNVTEDEGGRKVPDRTTGYRPLGDDFSGFDFEDFFDYADYSLSDYYVTDIMSVVNSIESDEATALSSALSKALVHVNSCGSDTALSGLAVTLPYGDSYFYDDLKTIFTNCGFDSDYISWLEKFTSVASSSESDYYDYDSWDDSWDGWDGYSDTYNWDDYSDDSESSQDWNDFDWNGDLDYDDTFNSWFNNSGADEYFDDSESGDWSGWLDEFFGSEDGQDTDEGDDATGDLYDWFGYDDDTYGDDTYNNDDWYGYGDDVYGDDAYGSDAYGDDAYDWSDWFGYGDDQSGTDDYYDGYSDQDLQQMSDFINQYFGNPFYARAGY